MKRLLSVILLASAIGCSESVNPSFNCLLASQSGPGYSTDYEYDSKGVLSARTTSHSNGSASSHETYKYDSEGKLIELEETSTGTVALYKFTYDNATETVTRVQFLNGVETGTTRYGHTANSILETSYLTGIPEPVTITEFTFDNDNITTEVYKEYLGPNKALSLTETITRSSFDFGMSPLYTFFSKAKGLPYSTSKNNPRQVSITTVTIVNGVSQPPETLNYIYTYTYNKSNATLTKNHTIAVGNGNPVPGHTETNTYQGCD